MAQNPFDMPFAGAAATEGARPKGGVAPAPQPAPEEADPVVVGGLLSPVPGRTDRLEIRVPAGSYVLPADIVSALGEGNTLAGTQVLDEMFGASDAGAGEGADATIPIIAAGGEYVVTPAQVAAIAGGDIDAGHELLDAFVKDVRRELVKTLQKLPGPQK